MRSGCTATPSAWPSRCATTSSGSSAIRPPPGRAASTTSARGSRRSSCARPPPRRRGAAVRAHVVPRRSLPGRGAGGRSRDRWWRTPGRWPRWKPSSLPTTRSPSRPSPACRRRRAPPWPSWPTSPSAGPRDVRRDRRRGARGPLGRLPPGRRGSRRHGARSGGPPWRPCGHPRARRIPLRHGPHRVDDAPPHRPLLRGRRCGPSRPADPPPRRPHVPSRLRRRLRAAGAARARRHDRGDPPGVRSGGGRRLRSVLRVAHRSLRARDAELHRTKLRLAARPGFPVAPGPRPGAPGGFRKLSKVSLGTSPTSACSASSPSSRCRTGCSCSGRPRRTSSTPSFCAAPPSASAPRSSKSASSLTTSAAGAPMAASSRCSSKSQPSRRTHRTTTCWSSPMEGNSSGERSALSHLGPAPRRRHCRSCRRELAPGHRALGRYAIPKPFQALGRSHDAAHRLQRVAGDAHGR